MICSIAKFQWILALKWNKLLNVTVIKSFPFKLYRLWFFFYVFTIYASIGWPYADCMGYFCFVFIIVYVLISTRQFLEMKISSIFFSQNKLYKMKLQNTISKQSERFDRLQKFQFEYKNKNLFYKIISKWLRYL